VRIDAKATTRRDADNRFLFANQANLHGEVSVALYKILGPIHRID